MKVTPLKIVLYLQSSSFGSSNCSSSSSFSSSSSSSTSLSSSWREKLKPVHLEKVLGQLKNLTFFYLWCNLYYRARASSDESFLTFLTLPFGDLGSNKASKTPTEIFYTLCRKLWHIEKYSTLDVENCDRQTDRQSEVQKLRPGV